MPFAPTHFSPRVSLATMSFHVFSAIRELNFVEVQNHHNVFFLHGKSARPSIH